MALEGGQGWMEWDDIPMDVTHVRIHSSVMAIKDHAFCKCEQLVIVILNDGLEEIGEGAFCDFESLSEIIISNYVKMIGEYSFYKCTGLTTVTLGDGRRRLGRGHFNIASLSYASSYPTKSRQLRRWHSVIAGI